MKSDTFTTCIGIIVSLGLVLGVGTVLDGWALSTIWNWFMTPIFHLTSLTLWKAVGVSMVFEIFTRNNKKTFKKDESSDKTMGEAIIASLIDVTVVPLLSVFIAYIILQLAF